MRDLAKLVAEYHDLIHTVNKLRPETLLKLFNAIDVWRKPERLEQMIMTSEADAVAGLDLKTIPIHKGIICGPPSRLPTEYQYRKWSPAGYKAWLFATNFNAAASKLWPSGNRLRKQLQYK